MLIQCRNQQVNRRHIKLTYLLTAPEPASGTVTGSTTRQRMCYYQDSDEQTATSSSSAAYSIMMLVPLHHHRLNWMLASLVSFSAQISDPP